PRLFSSTGQPQGATPLPAGPRLNGNGRPIVPTTYAASASIVAMRQRQVRVERRFIQGRAGEREGIFVVAAAARRGGPPSFFPRRFRFPDAGGPCIVNSSRSPQAGVTSTPA